jgi:nucleoside-diphosphate-sugar epimerase
MAPSRGSAIYEDLSHAEAIKIPPVDAVIHLAQSHQYRNFPSAIDDILAVNTSATALLADLARLAGAQQFIFASTASVYSGISGSCREDANLQPRDFYAASKLAAETLLRPYSRYFRVCVLRLFTPYGPGQRNRLIPTLIQRVREHFPVTLDGAERGLRLSVAYVDDVAATFQVAAELGWQGTYNVAAAEPTSVQDIAETIGRLTGEKPIFARTEHPEPSPLIADLGNLASVYDAKGFRSVEQGLASTLSG